MTPTGLEPVCYFPQETLLPKQGDVESNALLAADVKLKVAARFVHRQSGYDLNDSAKSEYISPVNSKKQANRERDVIRCGSVLG